MSEVLPASFDLAPGAPVVLYLREPKEKVWGILVSLSPAGVVVRGLDLTTFEDWIRQEKRGEEPLLGLVTLFYPMSRLERLEKDEGVGPVESCAERFAREVGRSVSEVLGLDPEPRPVLLGSKARPHRPTSRPRRR
jgi:hypothetical protein